MAVSSQLKIQSKTQGAVTSTSSQQWALHLNIIHSASGGTTNLSDVEVCVAIQHYWLSANSLSGLTVYVDYAGNTNGGSGTRGDVTISFIDYDDNINVPIIYPLGENKRFKTIMKIKYINSTYTFSDQNNGITDLQLRIAEKNYKTFKYFNLDGVRTDMEDSYSYRDNAGANETIYADNNKIWINEISSGNLIWGISPHTNNNNIKYTVLLPKICSTINQSSPTTSYESDLTANINKGTYADAKRAIYVASGSTNNDIGRILRVEMLFKNTYAPYISNDNVSVCTLETDYVSIYTVKGEAEKAPIEIGAQASLQLAGPASGWGNMADYDFSNYTKLVINLTFDAADAGNQFAIRFSVNADAVNSNVQLVKFNLPTSGTEFSAEIDLEQYALDGKVGVGGIVFYNGATHWSFSYDSTSSATSMPVTVNYVAVVPKTPTWNETYNTGITLATSNINSGFIQTCWMFSSPSINLLIEKLLRSWDTVQKGVVLKFTTENSGGNGEIAFGNHNSASYVYPIIVIAYQERRIIF